MCGISFLPFSTFFAPALLPFGNSQSVKPVTFRHAQWDWLPACQVPPQVPPTGKMSIRRIGPLKLRGHAHACTPPPDG